MAFNRDKRADQQQDELDEHTVFINRCAKTVKGGRRMSFSAVIVVGDKEGRVGVGFGKANEVSDAIRKGGEAARKDMRKVTLHGKTIPHDVEGVCDGGRTLMHRRTKWQPTPVFLPGESQGRGGLVGCRLWGHIELELINGLTGTSQAADRN